MNVGVGVIDGSSVIVGAGVIDGSTIIVGIGVIVGVGVEDGSGVTVAIAVGVAAVVGVAVALMPNTSLSPPWEQALSAIAATSDTAADLPGVMGRTAAAPALLTDLNMGTSLMKLFF